MWRCSPWKPCQRTKCHRSGASRWRSLAPQMPQIWAKFGMGPPLKHLVIKTWGKTTTGLEIPQKDPKMWVWNQPFYAESLWDIHRWIWWQVEAAVIWYCMNLDPNMGYCTPIPTDYHHLVSFFPSNGGRKDWDMKMKALLWLGFHHEVFASEVSCASQSDFFCIPNPHPSAVSLWLVIFLVIS